MTKEEILEILNSVKYPGFEKSIVEFNFVKHIEVTDTKTSIVIEITASSDEMEKTLRDEISSKLSIENLELVIDKPQAPAQKSNTMSGKNIVPQIKNFIMVSSGKGGVGKSTTSVNLAVALAMQGKKVGLLDADIYGPNIPRMLGVEDVEPEIINNRIKPIDAYGIETISMGSLMGKGDALIWRGSLITRAVTQLLQDVMWGALDVLVIDMPPGTGDAQLTLAQSVPVTAGVNVTTPQHVALDDSARSLDMFKKLSIPIAGIIENMSGFVCPKCNEESDIFGKGTCEPLATKYDTSVMGMIPIEPAIREGGDSGKPIVYDKPESVTAKRYLETAEKLWKYIESVEGDNSAIQPTTNGVSACSTR